MIQTHIQDFSFAGVPSVWHIHLTGNLLTVVSTDMFKGLFLLRELRLDINFITSVESGAFSDLIVLEMLYLRRNQLQTLSASIFDALNHPSNLNDLYIGNHHMFTYTIYLN